MSLDSNLFFSNFPPENSFRLQLFSVQSISDLYPKASLYISISLSFLVPPLMCVCVNSKFDEKLDASNPHLMSSKVALYGSHSPVRNGSECALWLRKRRILKYDRTKNEFQYVNERAKRKKRETRTFSVGNLDSLKNRLPVTTYSISTRNRLTKNAFSIKLPSIKLTCTWPRVGPGVGAGVKHIENVVELCPPRTPTKIKLFYDLRPNSKHFRRVCCCSHLYFGR